jgi:ABC-type multidrug transport system ATPase subunit
MAANDAVVTVGLAQRYGRLQALRQVDLAIATGGTVLLTGANGAGKSTLLRLLGGLARPSSGAVRVFGGDPRVDLRVRRRIGMLSDQPMLYDELSAEENLRFFARLYGVRPEAARVRAALDQSGLAWRAGSQVRTLSRGLKQRLAWARACLHEPELLLLDEPFSGLDVAAAQQLRAYLLTQRRRGVTCVLVTHQLEYAIGFADHQVVLEGGRVATQREGNIQSSEDLVRTCARAEG